MATATGPWIEPTLVFIGIIIFRFFSPSRSSSTTDQSIGLSTIAGSIGGIVAIACGWTIPTLYFLDKAYFNHLLEHPILFCATISILVVTAGLLGFCFAQLLERELIVSQKISFPIGELVNKMIYAHGQARKTLELVAGIVATSILSLVQWTTRCIPAKLTLIPGMGWRALQVPAICLRFDLLPLFLSIGFVTGHVIALPLLFGLCSKIAIIDTLHRVQFAHLSPESFILAFVAGMVIQGALTSIIEIPKLLLSASANIKRLLNSYKQSSGTSSSMPLSAIATLLAPLILSAGVLYYCKFAILAQLYLIVFTLVCTYQVIIIAGKTGLAPFPRYATFVLIPGMFLFNFNPLQITVVSAFVEICAGVAVDLLFGKRMAQLANIPSGRASRFQLMGLLASAASIGLVFYVLITHFGLGSAELFAQRAQARALLVQNQDFDLMVMVLGGLFGFALRWFKVNYLLVLGGLLMPAELSVSLIMGGLLAYAIPSREDYYPFWSGVFAASSLWMVIKAIIS